MADRVIRAHCFDHPPLNPLPSREGKIGDGFLSRERNEMLSQNTLKNRKFKRNNLREIGLKR
jgi:hypothetical protein